MNKDVIQYIASEFLYHKDALHLICCNKTFHINPYQINFESNENIKTVENDFIEIIHFDFFKLIENQVMFETLKKINIKTLHFYVESGKRLEDCFKNIENMSIKQIIFGFDYCSSIQKLPQDVELIDFGCKYNCPLSENLPNTLKHIEFSFRYNHPLPKKLPQSLKTIDFGGQYNCELPDNLPDSIEKMIFRQNYNQPLPNKLPKKLKELEFSPRFNFPLTNLPNSIEKITFGKYFNHPLSNNLPKSLKEIRFQCGYNHSLPNNLPESLTRLWLGICYNKEIPDNLPKSLKCIRLSSRNVRTCKLFDLQSIYNEPTIFKNIKTHIYCDSHQDIVRIMTNLETVTRKISKKCNMKTTMTIDKRKLAIVYLNFLK